MVNLKHIEESNIAYERLLLRTSSRLQFVRELVNRAGADIAMLNTETKALRQ